MTYILLTITIICYIIGWNIKNERTAQFFFIFGATQGAFFFASLFTQCLPK